MNCQHEFEHSDLTALNVLAPKGKKTAAKQVGKAVNVGGTVQYVMEKRFNAPVEYCIHCGIIRFNLGELRGES